MSSDKIISRIYAFARAGLLKSTVWLRYCGNTFRMSGFTLKSYGLCVNQDRWEPQDCEWIVCNTQITIENFMEDYLEILLRAIEESLPAGVLDDNLF